MTHHRPRRPLKTDLVVLCDLSESVSSFAQFTLLLVFALREEFGRVRAFGFVDELDELTRFFTPGVDVLEAVTRLTERGRRDRDVRAYRLRAGASSCSTQRFPDVVGPRTSLLMLGDARSNYGDLALPVLRELAERARHAYWLNPERRGDLGHRGLPRRASTARSCRWHECRNLAQLGQFVRSLAG